MRIIKKDRTSKITQKLFLTLTLIAVTALSGFILTLENGKEKAPMIPISSDAPETPILETPFSPNSNGSIYLRWNSNITTTDYSLYKCNSWITEINGSVTWIANTTQNYIITQEYYNKIWYYVVRANNGSGNSGVSNCVSVQLQLPAAPQLNSLTDVNGTGKLDFSWNAVSNAINYSIYRCMTPINEVNGSVTAIGTVNVTTFTYYCMSPTNYYYALFATTTTGRTLFSNSQQGIVGVFDMAKHNSISVSTDVSFVDYSYTDYTISKCYFEQRTYVLTATFTFSRYNDHQIYVNYTTSNTHGIGGTYWEQTVKLTTTQTVLTQTASSYNWLVEDDYYFKFQISGTYWGYQYIAGNCPPTTLYSDSAPIRTSEIIIERFQSKPMVISSSVAKESVDSALFSFVLGVPNNNWTLARSGKNISNIELHIKKSNESTFETHSLSLFLIELNGNLFSSSHSLDIDDANYTYYFSISYDSLVVQNSSLYTLEVKGLASPPYNPSGDWPPYLTWIILTPIICVVGLIAYFPIKVKKERLKYEKIAQKNRPFSTSTSKPLFSPNNPPTKNAPQQVTQKPPSPSEKEYDPFADNSNKSNDPDSGWN